MKRIYTYGSLRLNEYNYNFFVERYGEENFKHIKTKTITGYELYSLGSYPVIIPVEEEIPLVVDEFEVSDEVFKSIHNMEIGAGYYAQEVDGNIIYYMEKVPSWNAGKVDSGDWSKYLKRKR